MDSYTLKDVKNHAGALARALGTQLVTGCNEDGETVAGALVLDKAAGSRRYVIEQYRDTRGHLRQPFGSQYRTARELCQVIAFALATLDIYQAQQPAPAPRVITILGRIVHRRNHGGMYNTAEVIENGETLLKTPLSYGGEGVYADEAYAAMEKAGIIPEIPRNPNTGSRQVPEFEEAHGIKFVRRCVEVSREKDA